MMCHNSLCTKTLITCPECRGTGYYSAFVGGHITCSTCDGKCLVCPEHGKYCW
ncbi:MAG: hypothetical protein LBV06_00315 [Propionibacteriaceae bacterium]|nr:hypothetical protein [Propionibacteriaceae bacterium]